MQQENWGIANKRQEFREVGNAADKVAYGMVVGSPSGGNP